MKFLKELYFCVEGHPVPWSTPELGVAKNHGKKHRYVKKNPALEAWQAAVHKAARDAYGPFEPSTGPIYLQLTFRLETEDDRLWGKLVIPDLQWEENQSRWKKMGGLPDRTNMTKAIEDACEDVFMVNDTQVRCGSDLCVWSQSPGILIRVGFLDPNDPLGDP